MNEYFNIEAKFKYLITLSKKSHSSRYTLLYSEKYYTPVYTMKPADVDSLRSEHESDEQWEVRKSFMLQHRNDFPEEELITLAQLFTNIEFLGCRYPPETMKRISHLAEKVSAKYKDSRKNKLKRTFVQASDAAEQKAKRTFKQ